MTHAQQLKTVSRTQPQAHTPEDSERDADSALLFNATPEVPARPAGEEKEIKGASEEKER